MTRQECTEQFAHYREIVRLVWNLGFWPDPNLREFDALTVFRETAARLFEGLVLMPLGYKGPVDPDNPGEVANCTVTVGVSKTNLLVEDNGEPGAHLWGKPIVPLQSSQIHRFKFINLFDWMEMDRREFAMLEVLILEFEDHPELVGRRALIPFKDCRIWMEEEKGVIPVLRKEALP